MFNVQLQQNAKLKKPCRSSRVGQDKPGELFYWDKALGEKGETTMS